MASNYEGVEWGGHHACLEMDVGRFRFEVINPHKEALLAPELPAHWWVLIIICSITTSFFKFLGLKKFGVQDGK